MDDWAALRLAVELLHVPWRVRIVRHQPLPEGIVPLLALAAGDPESERAAIEATGRPREVVRQAATFFVEQILLPPDADFYRVLGASPTATSSELRRNMALLMRWLHPDAARQGEQAVFAARIATAWNSLKTPDRRAAYDAERQSARSPNPGREGSSGPLARPRRSRRSIASGGRRTGGLPRMVAFLLGRPRY
jgi:DnaJ-like protein